MKEYGREDEITSETEIPFEDALFKVGRAEGEKVLVEFPVGVYDNPVTTGVGRRIANPDYPHSSSQRYAFSGSPHDMRIPRLKSGTWTVKYMARRYELVAVHRTHASGKTSIGFIAVDSTQKVAA